MFLHIAEKLKKAPLRPIGPIRPGKPHKRLRLSLRVIVMVLAVILGVAVFFTKLLFNEFLLLDSQLSEQSTSVLDTAANRYTEAAEQTAREINFSNKCRQERCALLGVLLDTYDTLDAVPDWDTVNTLFSARQIWLLDGSGGLLRGDALPEVLTRQQLARLRAKDNILSTESGMYYSAPCRFGTVLCRYEGLPAKVKENQLDLHTIISGISLPEDTSLLALDTEGRYLVGFNEKQTGTVCRAYDQLLHNSSPFTVIGNKQYHCITRQMEDGILLVAATGINGLAMTIFRAIQLPLILFTMVTLGVLLYAILLLTDRNIRAIRHHRFRLLGSLSVDITLLPRLTVVAVSGAVLLCAVTIFAQTLFALSQQNISASLSLDSLQEEIEANRLKEDDLYSDVMDVCFEHVHQLADSIVLQPAMLEQQNLERCAQLLDCYSIEIYDSSAKCVASSGNDVGYSLSSVPGTASYTCREVLTGDWQDVSADADVDDFGFDPQFFYIATRRRDTVGIVRLTVSSREIDELNSQTSLAAAAASADFDGSSRPFLIDSSTGTFRYAVPERLIDTSAAEAGLQTTALQDNYAGYQRIAGEDYYVNVRQYGELWMLCAVPRSVLSRDRAGVVVSTTRDGVVMLAVLLLLACLHWGKPQENSAAETAPRRRAASTYTTNGHRVNPPVMGNHTQSTTAWDERSPEEKFIHLLGWLCFFTVVITGASALASGVMDANSILSYVVAGGWERGVNIFAVTAIMLLFTVVLSISWVVRQLIMLATRYMGARGETAGRQLNSAIKYISVVGAAFYSLSLMGVHTSTLLASAGILSAVIGFGAQNLTGDILAGICIVFEGEFRVGDMVTIDGWRGVVLEVGLRTTKVENLEGDIQIFNNSVIQQVINMTQEYSLVVCNVSVDYGEDLERVEQILQEGLPEIRRRLPDIVAGPTYEDVQDLGDSGVVLRISAYCREEHRLVLRRALNREIKLLFDRKGVTIPFPQVVVHDGNVPLHPETEE